MAIVGYWNSLTEAQKLVQHELLLSGVIEEIFKEGEIIPRMPVFQIDTKEIIYYRESEVPSADFYDIGEQIPWIGDQSYSDKVTVELKRMARQQPLDNFMLSTYKTPNDYRAQVMRELSKGMVHWMEEKAIYGKAADDAKSFDGMCALVDSSMDTDLGDSALAVSDLRELVDSVRPRPNILLVNRTYAQKMDALLQESGLSSWASFNYNESQWGQRVLHFDGIPIIRSDFVSIDEDTDGDGFGASGDTTSIYAIRFGQIQEGGLCLCMGGFGGEVGYVFRVDRLERLEDYDAEGLSLIGYAAMALGSTKALGRIHGIDPALPITAT